MCRRTVLVMAGRPFDKRAGYHDSRRDPSATLRGGCRRYMDKLVELRSTGQPRAAVPARDGGGGTVYCTTAYCTTRVMGVVWLNCPELATTLMV